MSGSQAGLIVAEHELQDPRELILQRPMAPDRCGGRLGGQIGGGDIITGVGAAAILEFGSGADLNEVLTPGNRSSPGKRRSAASHSVSRLNQTVRSSRR